MGLHPSAGRQTVFIIGTMSNKALVVIDIQNDITKHYRDIIGNINAAIECVKDYVLQVHKQIYAKYNGDFDRIYTEGYNSKSYQGRVIEPGKVYELSYQECSCPKVKCGLRSNPEQCECSRQSILFILSQLEPDSRFDVRIENTILRGGERCTFRIVRHPV